MIVVTLREGRGERGKEEEYHKRSAAAHHLRGALTSADTELNHTANHHFKARKPDGHGFFVACALSEHLGGLHDAQRCQCTGELPRRRQDSPSTMKPRRYRVVLEGCRKTVTSPRCFEGAGTLQMCRIRGRKQGPDCALISRPNLGSSDGRFRRSISDDIASWISCCPQCVSRRYSDAATKAAGGHSVRPSASVMYSGEPETPVTPLSGII